MIGAVRACGCFCLALWTFSAGGLAAEPSPGAIGHGTSLDEQTVAERLLWQVTTVRDLEALPARDVQLGIVPRNRTSWLRIEAGGTYQWPGITLAAPGGTWDLSAFESLTLDVKNVSDQPVKVNLRVDSVDQDGHVTTLQEGVDFAAGQQDALRLTLKRNMPPALADQLFGMRGYPDRMDRERGLDPSRITQVLVFVIQAEHAQVIEINQLRAVGTYEGQIWAPRNAEQWLPLVDRFGQYRHRDWPGKTHSQADLARAVVAEQADLLAHPGPQDRDEFGGWTAGPQLEATGHFRTHQRQGRWWLVDPAGRLFWSHGIDCVRPTTAYTPITDREHLFAELPSQDSVFGPFYSRASWAPHGYYEGKGTYVTYNFTGSNLFRKYGPEWQSRFNELCHQRIRSWGLNTVANWSDHAIYRMERTPYVATVSSGRTRIEGSTGYWGKFPDPFAPEFAETTRRNMQAQQEAANSAWCVGVFIDNELAWGEDCTLALAALASGPKQAAKIAFVESLTKKYASIGQLNQAWGTDHADWPALLACQTPPDKFRAAVDLRTFCTRIAEQYFRVCRDAVKEYAPETLYLGCRFAWVNDRAVRAATKYCDVVGFNRYESSVADFQLPAGVDLPAIIGEFHFGALDRGMFHTGLKATENQEARAEAYTNYVRGAIQNPCLVGTHWFQFGDQATTGRGDGENYQIGFLDVCDTPYPEIIQASREVAAQLYPLRSAGRNE